MNYLDNIQVDSMGELVVHQRRYRLLPGQILGKPFIRGLNSSLARSLARLNKTSLSLVSAYVTGHVHFRNNLATVCFLQGYISCILCGQAPEFAKHILLESESLDIRRRIFEGKQP